MLFWVLIEGFGLGLEIQDAPHCSGIILGGLNALTGRCLVLQTILSESQLVELIDQRIGECVGSDAHGNFSLNEGGER